MASVGKTAEEETIDRRTGPDSASGKKREDIAELAVKADED
jgi:hypothetical protein